MDGFLEKNLKQIERYNPELCDEIRKTYVSDTDFGLGMNLAGEYNIQISGRPVHSVTGAQQEAQEIFDTCEKGTMNIVHVIYGLGLGYLFDVFCEKGLGIKILYEPDLKLLKYVLSLADLSENLSKPDVFVASDNDGFARIYGSVYRYNYKTRFYALDFHKSAYAGQYKAFEKFASLLCAQNNYNHQYLFSHLGLNLESMFKNFAKKISLPHLSSLEQKFKGKTAVIASAGPSLQRNIEDLKKYRDKVTIFAVGTSLKVLEQNEIMPDFVCYCEKYYAASQFDGIDTSSVNFIIEPSSAPELFDLPSKNKFLTLSYENNTNHLFAEICGIELPYFEVKGTVSYQALSSAKLLGFERIILLGQDLAYSGGNCYSKGSVYENLVCVKNGDSYKLVPKDREALKKAYFAADSAVPEEDKDRLLDESLANLNNSLDFVKGVNEDILPASADFKRFITYFEDFASKNTSLRLYNASFGAQINGFENKHLCEILESADDMTFSVSYEGKSMVSVKKVVENLRYNKNNLYEALAVIDDILSTDSDSYSQEQLLEKFEAFNLLRSKNHLLRLVTYFDYTYMSWYIKEYLKSSDTRNILRLKYVLYDFFVRSKNNSVSMIETLNKIIGEINEGSIAKS